jgi:glycosyltransferase involved in cell wall biosynthesis
LEIALRGLNINNSAKTYGVFLSTGHRGWILDAIARESAEAINLKPSFDYLAVSRREMVNPRLFLRKYFRKKTDVNLFMHHDMLLKFPKKHFLHSSDNHAYLTHFSNHSLYDADLIWRLRMCNKVIVQNSYVKSLVAKAGIDEGKIFVAFGAVDRGTYFPMQYVTELKSPYVIIVGDCKPRKRPDLIGKVIESAPDIDFLIHGKNWLPQLNFQDGLPANLEIKDFELSQNPKLIRYASAILSVADLEGGPYPLIEALASGTPVASSDSGFASQLVSEESGLIFPINADIATITNALRLVMEMKKTVATTDLLHGKLTWRELGLALYE